MEEEPEEEQPSVDGPQVEHLSSGGCFDRNCWRQSLVGRRKEEEEEEDGGTSTWEDGEGGASTGLKVRPSTGMEALTVGARGPPG